MAGLSSLAALEGRWTIDRRIVHSDGTENRFEGVATFTRSGLRLVQDEDGQLSMPNVSDPIRATRRYVWTAVGNRLDCAFPDNRPFHSVPLGVAKPEATYLCPPDRYQVSYDFTGSPDWSSTWHVEGPRKDYRMVSRYTRVSR